MYNDLTLFKEKEVKSTTLTLRMTPLQKQFIIDLARDRDVSAAQLILSLVGKEQRYLCGAEVSDYEQ